MMSLLVDRLKREPQEHVAGLLRAVDTLWLNYAWRNEGELVAFMQINLAGEVFRTSKFTPVLTNSDSAYHFLRGQLRPLKNYCRRLCERTYDINGFYMYGTSQEEAFGSLDG